MSFGDGILATDSVDPNNSGAVPGGPEDNYTESTDLESPYTWGIPDDSPEFNFDNFGPEDPGSGLGLAGAFNPNASPNGFPVGPGSGFSLSDMFNSRYGKFARGLLSAANPTFGILNGLYGLTQAKNGYDVARGALGMAGLGAGPTIAGRAAIDMAQGKSPIGSIAGGLGAYVGGQTGIPGGSTLGGWAGGQIANAFSGAGRSNNTTSTGGTNMNSGGMFGNSGGGNGPDWETLLPSLAGIYSDYRGMKSQGDVMKQAGSLGGLSDLFGPNSATAQAMRQNIERRDAAAGRRSQYGPREVELAAMLAKLQAESAPGIMNANTSAANMRMNAEQQRRARMNSMLGIGLKALPSLSGLFGGGQSNNNMVDLETQYSQGGPSNNVYAQPTFEGYGDSRAGDDEWLLPSYE